MAMRLLPSLREKKRYLAFEIISEGAVSRRDFIDELDRSASSLLGDVGSSECGLNMLTFDRGGGIIKCERTKTELMRAVLATVNRVRGVRVAVHVIGSSGSVKGAGRFAGRGGA
uniref:Ribonuclease P protein component 2 n=1 Tax=Candidatus Methanogaster sp. ANME-2c ERB4 TaxID=2759911 RepID=A0A7G9YHC8_9EURY|nr:ribonuclease P protein component 2 [Methanosarcinales archaeon ANME-2c ERB4]